MWLAGVVLSALGTYVAWTSWWAERAATSLSVWRAAPPLAPGATAVANASSWLRLPRDLRPVHYDLTLLTDLQDDRFQGVVNITLDVLQDTRTVTLNVGDDLDVSSMLLDTHVGTMILPPERDRLHERVTLSVPMTLTAGSRVSLVAGFRAPITPNMVGYYYAAWAHRGERGHYALTQFEPTAARDGFPCWDEPDLKATFRVRQLHRRDTTALANMPASATRRVARKDVVAQLRVHELRWDLLALDDDTWLETSFAPTPPMSTYLVAYANGRFEQVNAYFTSTISGRRVPLRVYTTPEFIGKARDALHAMTQVVPLLESMFQVEYPLPKLDMVVAAGFDSDAMENWGLITGRSTTFLTDAHSSLRNRQYNVIVMAHEVAHMWFGDIATMAWWDSLWLNEAFATLVGEVMAMTRLYPEWELDRRFLAAEWNRALDLDAMRASHPVQTPLQGEVIGAAVSQVFDAISYAKGACVLRMLSKTIGEDTFLQGVSQYLQHHLYGNTHPEDLWRSISHAADRNVSDMMQAWVTQQGFPVLTVTTGKHSLLVKQTRFLASGAPAREEDSTLWHVPLALKVLKDNDVTVHPLVLEGERSIEVPLPDAHHTLWKLNADAIGAYRVAYPPSHLANLAKARHQLSAEDRIGLVSDVMRLAQANYLRTSNALDFLLAMQGDEDAAVEDVLASSLAMLVSVAWEQPDDVQAALLRVGSHMFGPLARTLTLHHGELDSVARRSLRTSVVEAAAMFEDEWTLTQIELQFMTIYLTGDLSAIHPDWHRLVLVQGVRHGGEKAYKAVKQLYYATEDPEVQKSAMIALCYATDTLLLAQTTDFIFSDDVLRQNLLYAYEALASNPHARRLLWEVTQIRYDEIVKVFSGNVTLVRLLVAAISSLSSEADAVQIERFFASRETDRIDRGLAQGLESIRTRAQWISRDDALLRRWLEHHPLRSS